ncbi:hypothetical protein ABKN59_000818 [Abortiporus biennis]
MPSTTPDFFTEIFRTATSIPKDVLEVCRTYPREANVMLPHLEHTMLLEQTGAQTPRGQLWIVCRTVHKHDSLSVDFVLSCIEGPLGSLPIFIFTPHPTEVLSEYIERRITALARATLEVIPLERVFAVFAQENITRSFANVWTQFTRITLASNAEYYHAKLTYCTKHSFRQRQGTVTPENIMYKLRRAEPQDAVRAAPLLFGFAAESEPYTLTEQEALVETNLQIAKGELWIHDIWRQNEEPEIASIVSVTRTSETVAAITKVYTNPAWRRHGCAERLVRRVCKHLLETKESVVLYVAHNNPKAAGVYRRVGFAGLGPNDGPTPGVTSWLELGFDRNVVHLGHW